MSYRLACRRRKFPGLLKINRRRQAVCGARHLASILHAVKKPVANIRVAFAWRNINLRFSIRCAIFSMETVNFSYGYNHVYIFSAAKVRKKLVFSYHWVGALDLSLTKKRRWQLQISCKNC